MSKCYDVWTPGLLEDLAKDNGSGAAERYLVAFALQNSDFGNTTATRHSFLLNATQQIVDHHLSQPLDPEQWKLEVRRLFDMSLLRIKFEILAAARGDRASFQNYNNILPFAYREVCGKVKYQVKGYVNLSLVGLLCAIFLPIVLGLPINEKTSIEWVLFYSYRLVVFLISYGLNMFRAW
jgi:hypothetical protein